MNLTLFEGWEDVHQDRLRFRSALGVQLLKQQRNIGCFGFLRMKQVVPKFLIQRKANF